MKNKLIIAGLIIFSIFMFILCDIKRTEYERYKARHYACIQLASEIDTVYAGLIIESDKALDTFIDYLTGHISYERASHDIDEVDKLREIRKYNYNLAIDKYGFECFGVR
jgi:hypothetical protein